MLTKEKLQLRIIATILCLAFSAQELQAAPGLVSPVAIPGPQEELLRNPELLEVPLDFSKLSEIHRGTKDVLIIHIQDAHSNYSGQKNLASTLDDLMTKYQASLVLSEGGHGDCSLNKIKTIAEPAVWQRVAKSFLMSVLACWAFV